MNILLNVVLLFSDPVVSDSLRPSGFQHYMCSTGNQDGQCSGRSVITVNGRGLEVGAFERR